MSNWPESPGVEESEEYCMHRRTTFGWVDYNL
jgi:hypothetical protein